MTSTPAGSGFVAVAPAELAALKLQAGTSELGRARICLHRSHGDQIQEMVVAIQRGTYIPPHRHPGKSESLHLIEGRLLAVFFDDSGRVTSQLIMGDPGGAFLYRLSSDQWHTVLCLGEQAVFHEAVCGPFEPERKSLAPWAPDESDGPAVASFMGGLLKRIEGEGGAWNTD